MDCTSFLDPRTSEFTARGKSGRWTGGSSVRLCVVVGEGHLEQSVLLPTPGNLEVVRGLAVLDEAVLDENSLGSFVVDEGLCLETMEAKPLTGDALRGGHRRGCEALTILVLGNPIADAC